MYPRLAASAFVLFLVATLATAQSSVDGHWEGEIETPGGALDIDVDLVTSAEGELSGDISIPAQGARDLDLTDLLFDSPEVTFVIPGIPGTPTFQGTLSDDQSEIAGTFSQGGAELAFRLVRGDDLAAKARVALEGFDEVAARALEDFNVPGAALAVVAGGEVVYAKGFGFRDLEAEKPMTPDTLFAIGSTTKAMTSTVLGTLVDEGLVEWDEPVRRYLPGFTLNDSSISERITVRDLVTHRSGLPRHDLLWYNNNEIPRAEMVDRLAHLELSADLRERFQYNNLMYMTAGYLAGQLTDQTWEEVMRQRLHEPLGMERTNFSVSRSQQDDDFAYPYKENDEKAIERIPFRSIDLVGPAGSVNSSVHEMTRWLLLNLRNGRVDDEQLINPATLADIQSAHMTTGETQERVEISPSTYGLGWSLYSYRGHRVVSHGGGIDGFATAVMFLPDDDIGLVSFDNRAAGIGSLINRHAVDRLLGLEEIDWLAESKERRDAGFEIEEEAKERARTVKIADTRPSRDLAAYAGDYLHPGYGTLRVSVEEDELTLLFNGIEAPLEHWHYEVWNGAQTDGDETFEDTKFLFRGDVNGNIAAVESTLEPRTAPIVFEKQPDARLFDAAYLQRFVGSFETATGTKLTISLVGDGLTLTVPGQPVYPLVPILGGRFELRDVRIISLEFVVENDSATKLIIYQPGVVFEAPRMEDAE